MWKHLREVNQFAEQIEDRAALGTRSPVGDPTARRDALDQLFSSDDRFDHQHVMTIEQPRDFPANGGERTELDFDQLALRHRVNAETVQLDLGPLVVPRVNLFQLTVQRGFHTTNPA